MITWSLPWLTKHHGLPPGRHGRPQPAAACNDEAIPIFVEGTGGLRDWWPL